MALRPELLFTSAKRQAFADAMDEASFVLAVASDSEDDGVVTKKSVQDVWDDYGNVDADLLKRQGHFRHFLDSQAAVETSPTTTTTPIGPPPRRRRKPRPPRLQRQVMAAGKWISKIPLRKSCVQRSGSHIQQELSSQETQAATSQELREAQWQPQPATPVGVVSGQATWAAPRRIVTPEALLDTFEESPSVL